MAATAMHNLRTEVLTHGLVLIAGLLDTPPSVGEVQAQEAHLTLTGT